MTVRLTGTRCWSGFGSIRRQLPALVVGMLFAATALSCALADDEGVCARVKIRLSQDVVIARNGFRATLEISNAPLNVQLGGLKVSLDIRDEANQPSNDKFGVHSPELCGVSDVDGGGVVQPGSTASAKWLLVPTRDAAPDAPAKYFVGGEFSYTQSGETVTIPLFPAPILVKPDPLLVLDYFLVRDVYSDDPFTPEIEPAEPFPLGLMVRNNGKGVADNFRIGTSEPKIIDNEKGLLVDFRIVSAQVNGDTLDPSLTLNLGNIDPGKVSIAKWMLTASLQGKFTEYNASFTHIDGMGNPRLSLIDAVNVHELNHAVRVDTPVDDDRPDFLVNDIADELRLPDALYNSDSTVAPVTALTGNTVATQTVPEGMQASLTVGTPPGWVYIRGTDPGGDVFVLKRVVRSDGKVITLDDNAWTTRRTIREQGRPPVTELLVHIFDRDSTGGYTLYYDQLPTTTASLSGAKRLGDGERVDIGKDNDVIATATFPGFFYVQTLDRASGLRVAWADPVTVGSTVRLTGILGTTYEFERYLHAASLDITGTGTAKPLAIQGRDLGGQDIAYDKVTGAGQHAVKAWHWTRNGGVPVRQMAEVDSVSNLGLLVTASGRVTGTGTGFFYLDDGSHYDDFERPDATNGMPPGVKVVLPDGVDPPAKGTFVITTGISSCYRSGSDAFRLIRVWRASDVATVVNP